MSRHPLSWLLLPFHVAALATGAKSFRDNPVIGSPTLNQWGLHVGRMRLAAAMAEGRRRRLARLVSAEDAAAFARDGFVMKRDYLPAPVFDRLREAVLGCRAPARDMIQGDAVTRRIAVDRTLLARLPALRDLVENPHWLGLVRYVGSSALTPLCYIQTIFSRVRPAPVDPQTHLHADTFHSSVKAWLFLTDVAEDDGPFVYVPGSHRPAAGRLAWERQASIAACSSPIFQSARGSLRITEAELAEFGIGTPRAFAVPANTLIVADTMGFHARGLSSHPSTRVELWAYGRRNPYLPWTGLDPVGLPLVEGRAIPLAWRLADVEERLGLGRNPWRPAGRLDPATPPDLALFA